MTAQTYLASWLALVGFAKSSDVRKLDRTGHVHGDLTVLKRDADGRRWRCKCSCGNETSVSGSNLKTGHVKSCGCRLTKVLRDRNASGQVNRKYADPTTSARNTVIYGYKRAAKRRGFSWGLTTEECVALFSSPCVYCGAPPANTCQMYGGSLKPLPPYTYSGIDRLDPSLGYTPMNVASACHQCNWAKGELTVAEFKAWVNRVSAHGG